MRAAIVAAWLGVAGVLAGCTTTVSQSSGPVNETRQPAAAAQPNEPADAARRARVRMELAAAYLGRNQPQVALEEVQRAIAADPTLGAAYNLRGLIQASLGDPSAAEESFRRALQLNPRDGDAMQNFGWFLCQQKRYADADAQFAQALAVPQYRDTVRTLFAQGVCRAFSGDLVRAEQTLQRAYELDPANPATAVNLAEVLYRRGEFERARFYIRRVNAQPAVVSAQTLWLAARIENKLGNRSGAQEFGNQLRSRFGDSREALAFDRGQFDD